MKPRQLRETPSPTLTDMWGTLVMSETLDEAEAFMSTALRKATALMQSVGVSSPISNESVALVAHGLIVFYASAKLRENIEDALNGISTEISYGGNNG